MRIVEFRLLYNKLYSKGVRSKKDALELPVWVEVEDVAGFK